MLVKGIPRFWWNAKVQDKSPPYNTITSHINAAHTVTTYIFKLHLSIKFEVLKAILLWCCHVQVLGFGAVWICRSLPMFRRHMLSPSSGDEVKSMELEGLYRTWRAKAEGREPIRERECGKGMRTNKKTSDRLNILPSKSMSPKWSLPFRLSD
jgi:hypothetical protein